MTLLKRARLALATIAVTIITCACLAGCGEPLAATYDGGNVPEETVTATIENMRTYYGLTDDADWAEFVKTRAYDTGESSMQTAVEKAAAANKPAEDATEGTVEDMREYVIEQIVRSELVQREIKNRKIEIADEEVDAYVEQQRAYVEARLMEVRKRPATSGLQGSGRVPRGDSRTAQAAQVAKRRLHHHDR